jgi:di/tricarboxylate transporter
MSAVLTNNAAAVLMYPIAMQAAEQANVDRLKMAYILMLAASDYMTSFGYQTNLMVYGPGGYSNMDFMRFGAPMQIILWLSSTAMIAATMKNWYVSWLVTAIALVVVAAVRLSSGGILRRKKAGQVHGE